MLYLHKLLPSFFLPIGITIILVGAGLLLRKQRLGWLGIAFLYLVSTQFVSEILLRWLEGKSGRREVGKINNAEAIVVLSGGIKQMQNAPLGEWDGVEDRFEGGVELFQAGKAPLLIFTGGHVPWRPDDLPEGEVLKERAVRLGLPKGKITVTSKAGNTEEEASAVKVLLENIKRRELEGKKRNFIQETAGGRQLKRPGPGGQMADSQKPRVILITSAFHMHRAKMLFERKKIKVEPFPVDFKKSDRSNKTVLSFIPTARALANSETAMREGIGLLYYKFLQN